MLKLKFVPVLILLIFCGVAISAEQQEKAKVTKIESAKVCMINDRAFEKDQIPVEVDGKTYYGCCEMCKKALNEKPETRVSVDPVSGKEVDKAKAVIGIKPDGSAIYFENQKNLDKYNASQN